MMSHLLLLLAALLVALPAGAVEIEWVYVGDSGNPPDTYSNCVSTDPNCGQVLYAYYISKYEVTNAQYVEFLNAVGAADPNDLYNGNMASDYGGITRNGEEGSYSYALIGGRENWPVNWISWYDTLRFANWLHNGQPVGPQGATTTEDGAYTVPAENYDISCYGPCLPPRRDGALVVLPTGSEWYKAAYYDPALSGYYDYPAGTDTPILCATPSPAPNTANCQHPGQGPDYLTDVGSYTGSPSPYGTFDQGGNVWEWVDERDGTGVPFDPFMVAFRGGSGSDLPGELAASPPSITSPYLFENFDLGFRVARLVPEPAQVLLVLTGGFVLAVARRQLRT
jgi:formylglycine-generating enzyme required for sulfatase activity